MTYPYIIQDADGSPRVLYSLNDFFELLRTRVGEDAVRFLNEFLLEYEETIQELKEELADAESEWEDDAEPEWDDDDD
jgi:hypothetical protein